MGRKNRFAAARQFAQDGLRGGGRALADLLKQRLLPSAQVGLYFVRQDLQLGKRIAPQLEFAAIAGQLDYQAVEQ
ncbi:hypothetical protein D3C72_1888870 [compost metagenome]